MARAAHIALVAGLAAAASPGAALTPLPAPDCLWQTTGQRFAQSGREVWVEAAGNGFATFFVEDAAGHGWRILHHCPSDKYLLIAMAAHDVPRIEERFRFFLETTVEITMEEMALDLATMGAGVRRGRGDIGRCDCDTLAAEGALQ